MIKNNVKIIITGFILLCVALCTCIKYVNADDYTRVHIKNYNDQYIFGGEWAIYEYNNGIENLGDELYRFGNGNGLYNIPKSVFSRKLIIREISSPDSYAPLSDSLVTYDGVIEDFPAIWMGPGYNIPNDINFTYAETGDGTLIKDGKLKIKKQTNINTDENFKFRIKFSKKNKTVVEDFNYYGIYLPESGLDTCISFSDNSRVQTKMDWTRLEINNYTHNLIVRWQGDSSSTRPSRVRVSAYRDNVFFQDIYLSEENNWSYQIQSSERHQYTFVARDTLSNYSTSINTNNSTDTTTITFTYNEGPPPVTPPESPDIPEPIDPDSSTNDNKNTLSIDKQLKTNPYSDKNNTVNLKAKSSSGDSNEQIRQCILSNNGAIEYLDRNSLAISGMRVRLYKIATLQGNATTHRAYNLTLEPNIRNYVEDGGSMPINGFSEAKLNEAINKVYGSREESVNTFNGIAAALAPYLKTNETPDRSSVTDSNGLFSLEGINTSSSTGALYVLIADGTTIEEDDAEYKYNYIPTLMSTWNLNVGIDPALNNENIQNSENIVPNSIETESKGASITYTWDEYFNPTPLPEGWTKIQDGIYEFTLKKDQEIDLNLPEGTQYEIEEIELPTNWELESKENDIGYIQSTTATSGEGTGVTALFKNKTDPKYTLNVNKNTTNNESGQFNFEVKVWKDVIDKSSYTDQYSELGQIGGWDGDNDQSWTITFPEGTVYQGIPMSGDYEIALDCYPGTDLVVSPSGLDLWTGGQFDGERIYGYYSPIYGNIKGYYNPMRYDNDVFYALADLMRKIANTPHVENPGADGSWTYVDDIIIDGVTYPLFVSGYNGIGSEHFYQVAISEYAIISEYLDLTSQGGNITSDEGVYEFEIGSGEGFTIPNIPYGYNYEVYEVDSQGNKILVGGNIGNTNWRLKSIDGNNTGIITDDTEVTFNNESYYNIEVNKSVTGSIGNKTDDFEFTIEFLRGSTTSDKEPYNLKTLPEGVTKVEDGKYRFTLKDGQNKLFEDMPYGVEYKIIENDYSSKGYTTYIDNSSIENRVLVETLSGNASHTFENRLNATVPTNVPKGINYTLVGLLLAVAFSMYYSYRRKKHNHI